MIVLGVDPVVVRDLADPMHPIYRVAFEGEPTATVYPGMAWYTDERIWEARCTCGQPDKSRKLGLKVGRRTCRHLLAAFDAIDNPWTPPPPPEDDGGAMLFHPDGAAGPDLSKELFD